MQLIIVAITFGATVGVLFLLNSKTDGNKTEDLVALLERNVIETTSLPSATLPIATVTPIRSRFFPSTVATLPTLRVLPTTSASPPTIQTNRIDIISLTSPVERGKTASLKIVAPVGSVCLLKYILPSGSVSGASDLQSNKTSGIDGIIKWQWKIGPTTKLDPNNAAAKSGIGKITIDCAANGSSFNLSSPIILLE